MNERPLLVEHLRQALSELPEQGFRASFAEDCLLVTSFGTFHGRDGVEIAAKLLEEALPNARFRYDDCIRQGELCLLGWTAESDSARVEDGADSFLIQDGAIKIMTIHYTPLPP